MGFVDCWTTQNPDATVEESVTCRAAPTSRGTRRDYMIANVAACRNVVGCTIDPAAPFRVHSPIRLDMKGVSRAVVSYHLHEPKSFAEAWVHA
eukprot:10248843-Alexandrium_andersonii.AAC.1